MAKYRKLSHLVTLFEMSVRTGAQNFTESFSRVGQRWRRQRQRPSELQFKGQPCKHSTIVNYDASVAHNVGTLLFSTCNSTAVVGKLRSRHAFTIDHRLMLPNYFGVLTYSWDICWTKFQFKACGARRRRLWCACTFKKILKHIYSPFFLSLTYLHTTLSLFRQFLAYEVSIEALHFNLSLCPSVSALFLWPIQAP